MNDTGKEMLKKAIRAYGAASFKLGQITAKRDSKRLTKWWIARDEAMKRIDDYLDSEVDIHAKPGDDDGD
tara:strand:+ start:1360 stop:1569 length:210 start_codon:yes stop_codon:yes gene_type:complete